MLNSSAKEHANSEMLFMHDYRKLNFELQYLSPYIVPTVRLRANVELLSGMMSLTI